MPEAKPPFFAAHCEIQDAAASATLEQSLGAPAAATIEFAKVLQRFDSQIRNNLERTPADPIKVWRP